MDSESDPVSAAVASFRAGVRRDESFRLLFETYYPRVRRYFARRTNSLDQCLDLTQETFLRVYRGLEGFRGDAPFGAWLFRIASNLLSHSVRPGPEARSREVGAQAAEAELAVAAEGFDRVLEEEQRELLRRAIEALPDQRRRCMVLWVYQGLSYAQVAAVLKLSLGTVKAHLAQARKQLEELMTDER